MPSVSPSQQKLFGMVYAFKKGKLKMKNLSDSLLKKIEKISDKISLKAAKEFASTKHKDMPENIKESLMVLNFDEYSILNSIEIDFEYDKDDGIDDETETNIKQILNSDDESIIVQQDILKFENFNKNL